MKTIPKGVWGCICVAVIGVAGCSSGTVDSGTQDGISDVGGKLVSGSTGDSALSRTVLCKLTSYAALNQGMDEWVSSTFSAKDDPTHFGDESGETPALDVYGNMYKVTDDPSLGQWWSIEVKNADGETTPQVGFVAFSRPPGTARWTRVPASPVPAQIATGPGASAPTTLNVDYYSFFKLDNGQLIYSVPGFEGPQTRDFYGEGDVVEYGFFPIPTASDSTLVGDGGYQIQYNTIE